jgi:hypothetical protein
MEKEAAEFTATSVLTVTPTEGGSSINLVKVYLKISENLNSEVYVHPDGMPKKPGLNASTHCFIQGLVSNIHVGHQKGIWDSAEHLRFIIAELERGFVEQFTVSTGRQNG